MKTESSERSPVQWCSQLDGLKMHARTLRRQLEEEALRGDERPDEVADVDNGLEVVHLLDDRLRLGSAQNRLHQVARLRVHLLGVERILLRTRRESGEVADGLAAAQGHLDEAASWRGGVVQLRVSDHLHPLHDGADRRIAHVLARVTLLER